MKKIITTVMAVLLTMAAQAQKQIEVQDLVSGKFNAYGVSDVTPMADGQHYLTQEGPYILKYSFKGGDTPDTILNIRKVKGESLSGFSDFILSPTEDMILLETNRQKIFRRSSTANWYIYSIKNNRIDPLSNGGPQQVPLFSPDGHQIAFVRDNNIYLVKLLFGNAESQVTKDGKIGKVRNGIPDWAYEEEFGFTRAFDFSADSRLLAWIRFDESTVESYNLPFFLTHTDSNANSQKLLEYRPQQYPTAGAANSTVSVHTFDIKSSVIRDIDLKLDSTCYIPRIKFVQNSDNSLFIFTLNRPQNKLEIYSANPLSRLSTMILREEDKRYLDEWTYMGTQFYGNKFIMQSERDGHRHLYLYDLNGRLERQITKGDFEVLELHGYDANKGITYFESNEDGIYDCGVWKADAKGKRTKVTLQKSGTAHAIFSSDFSCFIENWSDMDTPTQTAFRKINGSLTYGPIISQSAQDNAKEYGLAHKEHFSFKTVDGTELHGWLVRPSDASASNPCPIILYQYSGPGSNELTNEWGAGFYPGGSFETLLTQHGYAVAVVDGRGTGRRGADFKKQTYKQLGVLESQDQVAAAKYLGGLDWVDADRIAIWGWSFGGYNTLMSMSEGTPVFKCGVAVAPVTDWRFYDAPYTERFMRQPKENPEGYASASAIERIDNLHGKLLIVQGLDDDNVFFSNSTAYIERLIEKGIDFDMQVYPGKEHSITGPLHRTHLFNRIIRFFDENLK